MSYGVYLAFVTIHVLAATVWLGGVFFLGLVGVPVLRRLADPGTRRNLLHDFGERFSTVGWWAIAVLIATGIAILHLRGLLRLEVVGNPAFWRSSFGLALGVKLGAIASMLALTAAHASLSRSAYRTGASDHDHGVRTRAALLGRTAAVVGLIILVAAVRLARPG